MAEERSRSQRQYVPAKMPSVFLPFQHPRLVAAPPDGVRWIHEVKFDGYRVQLHVRGSAVTIFTRNGHDWTAKFPELAHDLAVLPNCILDAELCALDPQGHAAFSRLHASIAPGRTAGLVVFVFDVLWGKGEDLRPYTLTGRRHVLEEVLGFSYSERIRDVERFPSGGRPLLASACKLGLEGVVSKLLDAPYSAGKCDTWVKVKCRPSQEVVIGGWKQASLSPFKALLVGVYDKGRLTYAGSIKAGFSASGDLLARLKALETSVSPFVAGEQPPKTADIHWTRPELVAAAEIAEWTASGQLRQASFKGLREDKRPEEVVREPIEVAGNQ